jgi:hypothetical protein
MRGKGAAMASHVPSDDEIAVELNRRAAEGYETDAAIVESVIECLVESRGRGGDVPGRVRRLAAEVFDARSAVERTWPVPTACDRLDRAFASLERAGIVARQHFSCCGTCGAAEISDEIEAARARRPVRGYTFFHVQDTESAVAGDGLHLAYGAASADGITEEQWNRAAIAVGHEVVAALRAEGLDASWSGDLDERIHVPLEWRRRRRR